MTLRSSECMVGLLMFVLAGHHAGAATFDDVEFWVGTGANRAALVLDWNDGKSPEAFVWGYRWDGEATGLDMLRAVVEADDRLFAHVSEPGPFGVSVYGIGYDLSGDGVFMVNPAIPFDFGGWSVGSADDSRAAVDVGDHWAEGWNTGFWGYSIKGSADEPWASALTGPLGRNLSDGAWDGYSFAPGFNFTDPSEPLPAPVPEPRAIALLLIGGTVLLKACTRRVATATERSAKDNSVGCNISA
ncbi:MAG: hypothetical protein QHJ82_09590 [Verrucomicrobiota bacterium]|nr:hypothetical protein [Verrucomicrobiota bacterium]